MNHHWYIFRVSPQKEVWVASEMRRRGIHAIVPMKTVYRNKSRHVRGDGGKVERHYPVAPGYTWIRFDLPDGVPKSMIPWYVPFGYRQVNSVISLDEKPYEISDKVVTAWLDDERNGVFADNEHTRFMETGHEFSEGDIVDVNVRGLQALSGKVIEIRDRETDLLIELFGIEHVVKVPTMGLLKTGT